ncbi:cytochrome c oxidase assembly protein [Jannaschia helgolandensis]
MVFYALSPSAAGVGDRSLHSRFASCLGTGRSGSRRTNLAGGVFCGRNRGAESLFSAHMAQHITLMGLAAPLLGMGQPLATMTRALPRRWQRWFGALPQAAAWRRANGLLNAPGVATALMLGVFLFWQAPRALAVALEDDLVHAVMHGSTFAAALTFWTIIARSGNRGFWGFHFLFSYLLVAWQCAPNGDPFRGIGGTRTLIGSMTLVCLALIGLILRRS